VTANKDVGDESTVHFNLDDVERQLTGDPLVDRGMELTIDEIEEATDDSNHPDHEAAKAAQAHLAETMRPIVASLYGDSFRRIGENLAAALRPNMASLFPKVEVPSVAETFRDQIHAPVAPLPEPDWDDLKLDETSQQTLDAIVALSERMSEMVRVAAEHRDVALEQMKHSQQEATAARRSENKMLKLTWAALIGTWVATITAIVTVLVAL